MAAERAKKRGTTAEELEKKLSSRPVAQELQAKNILKTGDPNLQAAKQSLKMSQTKDVLNEKIAHRPAPSELEMRMHSQKERWEGDKK